MNDVLRDIVGKRVEIRGAAQDFRDEGILKAYDEQWVQLQKLNGELLFFPIAHIRLLKLLEY